jgi:hypothetical protein
MGFQLAKKKLIKCAQLIATAVLFGGGATPTDAREIPVFYNSFPERDPADLAPLVDLGRQTPQMAEDRTLTIPFVPRKIGAKHWLRVEYRTSTGEAPRALLAGEESIHCPRPGRHANALLARASTDFGGEFAETGLHRMRVQHDAR